MGLPAYLFDDLGPGTIFTLLPGPSTFGTHTRDYRQLPGAGIFHPAGSRALGRRRAPNPGTGNRACAGGNCDWATSGTVHGNGGSRFCRSDRVTHATSP